MWKMGFICIMLCLGWNGLEIAMETTCESIDGEEVCYGSVRRGEDRDWMMEIPESPEMKKPLTEAIPYDQEALHVAVSKEGNYFVYVVHSRWIEEFSTDFEFKWELLLIDASGFVSTRTELPGKPEHFVELFGSVSFFYPDSTVWTYDGRLQKTKDTRFDLVVSIQEVRKDGNALRWYSPAGEEDVADGIGLYRALWSVGAHTLAFDVTVVPTIDGIEDRGIYWEEIAWRSDALLEIDGTEATMSGRIDDVGHHTLVARGKNGFLWTWSFTLEPTLYGVPATPSSAPIRLYANASMFLDGQAYRIGTPIEKAGMYEILLTGTGGYVKRLSLTILSSAVGVSDGGIYDAPLSFVVNGTALLNGTSVSGAVEIKAPGTYELAFMEEGGPPRFVVFTVRGSASAASAYSTSALIQTALAAMALLGVYFVRKQKMTSGKQG